MATSRGNIGSLAGLLLGVLLLVLPASYMGAYYGLVQRGLPWSWRSPAYTAEYRIGGEAAETFFWPAHRIDRRIRPEYWGDYGW